VATASAWLNSIGTLSNRLAMTPASKLSGNRSLPSAILIAASQALATLTKTTVAEAMRPRASLLSRELFSRHQMKACVSRSSWSAQD
jgi:hypothetical protein